MKKPIVFILLHFFVLSGFSQSSYKIALLKYKGGGDWYANPTSLPNLIDFCNKNLGTTIEKEPATVETGSSEIFNYPFLHMTGHGNVVFSDDDIRNLRDYLLGGGFLHIDDNYGMDQYIRRELKRLFPEYELIELPFNHPIFHQKYDFNNGLPKIHEHDDKPPRGYAVLVNGRVVIYFLVESDIGDGWEDAVIGAALRTLERP